jgi:tRNA threonylcarbamoyladenosine modification (KEOPS) complex Cgi121 subunit
MDIEAQIYKLGTTFVSIIGAKAIGAKDSGAVIDDLRHISNKVSVQAIDANIVYGTEHLLEVLKITLESKRRRIMVAKNSETDLLLRLSYTNQISLAVKYGGMKNNANCCFVIFAKDKNELLKVNSFINKFFKADNSLLRPTPEKKKIISCKIGLTSIPILFDDDFTFVRFILERSCLIIK